MVSAEQPGAAAGGGGAGGVAERGQEKPGEVLEAHERPLLFCFSIWSCLCCLLAGDGPWLAAVSLVLVESFGIGGRAAWRPDLALGTRN